MRRKTEIRSDVELLAAYVDGVAELTPDERHRIEHRLAHDPDTREEERAVREVIERLRDLPPQGTEPDWSAMERSIGHAVGVNLPRPWWRRWQWIVPVTTFATAGAIVLALWGRHEPKRTEENPTVAEHSAEPKPTPAAKVVPLWLDGAEVDVDVSAPDALGGLGDDDATAFEADEVGLLPSTDLAWVDSLDDEAVVRAEQWLASRKRGG